jgi:proteasome lid subunit RPN8/RPN11
MSDVPDPQESDKRIIFGARKPTAEASPLTGIPLLIEAPFPQERTLHWCPVIEWNSEDAAEVAVDDRHVDLDPDDIPAPPLVSSDGNTAVVVSQEVLAEVNEHAGQSLDCELGGFLLGNRYRCPTTNCDYVIIDQYSPAKFTESSEVRLNFTHETWAQLADELSGKFLGKLLVGWYHSHPRMDVFLSSHDMEIQTERFSEPWSVALVLEPEKHLGGFFCARDGRVNPSSPVDFFELLERNSRESVIAWKNYETRAAAASATPAPSVTPVTSATAVTSATNAVNVSHTSSPVIPVIAAEPSEERVGRSPVRKKRRGRWFVAVAVVVLLAAGVVGFINRKRIRTWLQDRNILSPATSSQPTPVPTIEQQPIQQPVAPTPETAPSSSASPQSSPSPQNSPAPSSSQAASGSQSASSSPSPSGSATPAGTSRRRRSR